MTLMNQARVQRLPRANVFGAVPFVSESRIESLREMIAAGLTGRMLEKWNIVLSRPVDYKVLGPINSWVLYQDYNGTPEMEAHDANMEAAIFSDFMTGVDLAFRYRVETAPGREVYAAKVVEILLAWASIEKWDNTPTGSALTWGDHWPILLQAALMIRESPHYTATVDAQLKKKTRAMMPALCIPNGVAGYPISAWNNWSAVGNVSRIACAVFLQDRAMFDASVYRWRQKFNDSVVSNFLGVDGLYHDNVQQYEVYRQAGGGNDGSSGRLYCDYDFSAMMCAAEWARIGGEWLFDHVAPDGSSLQGLFEEIVLLDRYPDPEHHWFNTSDPPNRFFANQIYAGFDIAHVLWGAGNADAEWLVENRGLGPTTGGVFTDADNNFMRNTELLYRGRPLIG